MRALFALLGAGALVLGCGGGADGGAAGSSGAAGTSAMAGTTGAAGTTGSAGTSGAAGTSAAAGTPGTAGTSAAAGSTGSAGTGTAGTTSAAGTTASAGTTGSAGTGDLTAVAPTAGCGKDPGQALGMLVRGTIQTMGTKEPDCAATLNGVKKCGPWSLEREYYVSLPSTYDNTKAYPLVFEGPGCGGKGNNLYMNGTLDAMAIRVGLTPAPNSIGHGTNQNQGCFDDKEGDDSVDWILYENLWDRLAQTVCFDENRVFAAGNSSGAWMANELGCKYAGDPVHPIRGVMPNTGGLPTEPQYKPTCTTKGMAGIWVFGTTDTTGPFTSNIYAMNRALTVNGCTPAGVTYQSAEFDPFPISATDATSCKRFKGCPDVYPLVVCPLAVNTHGANDEFVNPAWVAFLKLFEPKLPK